MINILGQMIRQAAGTMLLLPLAASGAGFQYKGMPFGTSEAAFVKAQPGFRCTAASNELPYDRECVSSTGTYAGSPVTRIRANFIGDRLAHVSIRLRISNYPDVLSALREAYGPSTTGKYLGQTQYRWQREETEITVVAFPNSDAVIVMVETRAFAKDEAKLRDQRLKKGAKDL